MLAGKRFKHVRSCVLMGTLILAHEILAQSRSDGPSASGGARLTPQPPAATADPGRLNIQQDPAATPSATTAANPVAGASTGSRVGRTRQSSLAGGVLVPRNVAQERPGIEQGASPSPNNNDFLQNLIAQALENQNNDNTNNNRRQRRRRRQNQNNPLAQASPRAAAPNVAASNAAPPRVTSPLAAADPNAASDNGILNAVSRLISAALQNSSVDSGAAGGLDLQSIIEAQGGN
jgi:hypothetical protein